MTDLEISKALALAIGWTTISTRTGECRVYLGLQSRWAPFDYRDWNVIGPIAKHYGLLVDFSNNVAWRKNKKVGQRGYTPQKAIAMAVIQGAKK